MDRKFASFHGHGGTVAALLGAGIAWAGVAHADVTVCPTACDYRDIQTAVINAPAGQTIKIKAGVYPERVTITDKSLKLIGDGASATIIDGTTVLTPDAVINLQCSPGNRIVISDVTITGGLPLPNHTGGGGINNTGCNVSLEFSQVLNNSARGGGGILSNQGAFAVFKSTISGNAAGDLSGGGIDFGGGTLHITDSLIDNNHARNGGGGIANGGTLTMTGSTVSNNGARLGGGIANASDGNAIVTKSVLSGNGANRGGGVYNVQKLRLIQSFVSANRASTTGGGLFNTTDARLELIRSTVKGNTAASNGGGLFNQGVVTSAASTITANSPNDCAGVSCP